VHVHPDLLFQDLSQLIVEAIPLGEVKRYLRRVVMLSDEDVGRLAIADFNSYVEQLPITLRVAESHLIVESGSLLCT
jgi:hypothetical protein